uniref:Uncharacterized protein n=1 Tax=Glossina austeni TaxID=7395 RepID=A0A1A9UIC8_GLOAU
MKTLSTSSYVMYHIQTTSLWADVEIEVLPVKRSGNICENEGPLSFDTDDKMESLRKEENYIYLGFLYLKAILVQDMKEKTRSVLEKRLITTLKTKLNSKYTCKSTNTWTIPVYTYSFGVEKWSSTDLDQANRTIRTTM